MALQCNIDARGKHVRLITGIVAALAGVVLMFMWAWGCASLIAWVVSIALLGLGAFSIFEARHGWCALRAMGVKTRF